YICGPKVSSYLLAGGTVGWFVLMPLIAMFGGDQVIYPGSVPISEMGSFSIWSSYIKYIGAGAVAAGGIMSLVKSLPLIIRTFRDAVKGIGVQVGEQNRQNKDLPMQLTVLIVGIIGIAMWLIPAIPVNFIGAILIIVFGFFFATVSSRMVGIIGSSNNPVSGMTIATLLVTTAVLKASGNIGMPGMIAAITIGSVICVAAAIAGDTSQDLKTGYLVGASPYRQQIGEIIGVIASALAVGGVLYLLNAAWGYGTDQLPAPQATLMKLVVEGVMNGNLPWSLVFAGVFTAIVVEILGIPVLPFAVGLYLPIHLSIPMMVGGMVRLYFDMQKMDEKEKKDKVENGVLYSSGLIAGEGLVGILLAVFAVFGWDIDMSSVVNLGNIGGIVAFAILTATLVMYINRKPKADA
ncbi:MAG: OPT family oligopeptide transporter, partial [Lachnospiraceae bacterium]